MASVASGAWGAAWAEKGPGEEGTEGAGLRHRGAVVGKMLEKGKAAGMDPILTPLGLDPRRGARWAWRAATRPTTIVRLF